MILHVDIATELNITVCKVLMLLSSLTQNRITELYNLVGILWAFEGERSLICQMKHFT